MTCTCNKRNRAADQHSSHCLAANAADQLRFGVGAHELNVEVIQTAIEKAVEQCEIELGRFIKKELRATQSADTKRLRSALRYCRKILEQSDIAKHIEAVKRIDAAMKEPTPDTASDCGEDTKRLQIACNLLREAFGFLSLPSLGLTRKDQCINLAARIFGFDAAMRKDKQ